IEESGELHFKLRAPSRSRKTVKIILGVTLKNMNEKLIKMRDNAISIAVIIALFCISAVFIGVQQMTAPIKQLVAAMKKVSSGDLSHFVENHRKDELGFLADSFNEMIDKLKLSQEEIKNYTQILEKRVSDRTRELRESEEKYRTLFEHSGTAVTLIENNKRLLMVNKGFEMLSGYPKAEIEGKFTLSNFLIKDDRAKIKEYYLGRKTGSESGVPRNYECIFVDRYGRHRDVNLTMSTIPGTRYFLASLTDVSELKQLQKRLMRSEQLAAIGELSASIAHEIRNPLGAINTSVGILKGTLNLDRQDQELMEIICEEAMRLKRITDDFLQFAFPKTPDFRHKNINILLQEIMILMKHKLEGCIQTEMALDPTLPMVPVDVNQLKQVILNVLVNGIDSMNGSGKLTLATRCTRDANQEPQAVIELSDTGCGIKESEYYKIFQPFYSTKEKGAGMGLAICERIIQNHGGEIKVESAVGKGTKFTILLPLKV
ncbi:PAS domain S-box protein, partial [candidate division KSB1 bacterium]|nr:PAS domain S-box protein [candidate division KSB1 bacterium]